MPCSIRKKRRSISPEEPAHCAFGRWEFLYGTTSVLRFRKLTHEDSSRRQGRLGTTTSRTSKNCYRSPQLVFHVSCGARSKPFRCIRTDYRQPIGGTERTGPASLHRCLCINFDRRAGFHKETTYSLVPRMRPRSCSQKVSRLTQDTRDSKQEGLARHAHSRMKHAAKELGSPKISDLG